MSNPYLQHELITLYHNDFLKIEAIGKNSIDLIVTSPPYNLNIGYDNIDDGLPYEDYLEFTDAWLKKCYDLGAISCRLCLNVIMDKNKGGRQSIFADVITIAKKVGWRYHGVIIWDKDLQFHTKWGSWKSAAAPNVSFSGEVIAIMYKEKWKKEKEGTSDITKEEFVSWITGKWRFMGEAKRDMHPAPFPIQLPERCIKLFSFVEDTVLDPFVGSGTTLIACLLFKRKGIGVEISEKYCNIAKERLGRHGLFMADARELFV